MKWFYLAGLCLLLQACGGGDPSPAAADAACSASEQRSTLRTFMTDQYYWYAHLGTPDESAGAMDPYFRSMLYQPTDRFSFTQPEAAHNAVFVDGRRVGYGYSLVWGDAGQTLLRVRYVEPLSPVARAGLERGDIVLSIDDLVPQQIAAGQLPAVDTPGVPRRFVALTPAGVFKQFEVVSEDFQLSPVASTTTLAATRNGVPVNVGYVAYNQFVGYSTGQLSTALTRFASQGIQELILDLRYNGGGSVAVARDLASMVGGSRTAGKLFAYLRFNDKQANKTTQVRFNTSNTPFALPLEAGLERVFVITSGGTASASELVINGLKPFVDVVLVGDTTYGKPYGFVPRSYCGITYEAVQFESLNALGIGGYTAGFAPDCRVPDDLEHALGDPAERRIRTALDYVATGSCGPQSQALAAQRPKAPPDVFGETVPSQMFLE